MAFFGLTALGPQNSFSAASILYRNLPIFDEEDFRDAWNKVNTKDAPHCRKDKIPDIMRALFHGPVPSTDVDIIFAAFERSFETPETVSLTSYLKIMMELRDEAEISQKELEGKVKPTCEYVSSSELQLALKKNAAMKRNTQTKQILPMTAAQEVGWNPQQLQTPEAGREGSDITKFAAELVKNGIYY